MTRHDKTLERIQRLPTPTDVRWDEVVGLLQSMGFTHENNVGSHCRFHNKANGLSINMARPHPQPELKRYALRQLVTFLRDESLL